MDPNQGKTSAEEAIPENVVEAGQAAAAQLNAEGDRNTSFEQQINDAATTIQAAVRGHLLRKNLAQAAAAQNEADQAAAAQDEATQAAAAQDEAAQAAAAQDEADQAAAAQDEAAQAAAAQDEADQAAATQDEAAQAAAAQDEAGQAAAAQDEAGQAAAAHDEAAQAAAAQDEAATPDAVEAAPVQQGAENANPQNMEDAGAEPKNSAEPKNKDNVFIRIFKAIRDFLRNMFKGFTAMFNPGPGKGVKAASSDGLACRAQGACCPDHCKDEESTAQPTAKVTANG